MITRTRYRYETCCVNSTAKLITDMQDAAREVTYQTIRRHCDGVDEWAAAMGYDTFYDRGGLRLCNDWAVRFHKSTYNGRPCYYIRHSAIEYIWTAIGEPT